MGIWEGGNGGDGGHITYKLKGFDLVLFIYCDTLAKLQTYLSIYIYIYIYYNISSTEYLNIK